MFQSVFIRALLFAGFCTQCLADDQRPGKGSAHPAEASYKLIWQDEFDGDKLDRSKWAPEDDTVIGKYGHGNAVSRSFSQKHASEVCELLLAYGAKVNEPNAKGQTPERMILLLLPTKWLLIA